MKTDIIEIQSDGQGMEKALEEAERLTEYLDLDRKNTIRFRLLTEETLGMIRAITGVSDAGLWFEVGKNKTCEIHLQAEAAVDYDMKQELIKASSSGKNEAARGFMGMIRELFANGVHSVEEVNRLQMRYGAGPVAFGSLGMCDMGSMTTGPLIWSMEQYRTNLQAEVEKEAAAKEAWDELEKSIVANIADDVKVTVKGTHVELVISKNF